MYQIDKCLINAILNLSSVKLKLLLDYYLHISKKHLTLGMIIYYILYFIMNTRIKIKT